MQKILLPKSMCCGFVNAELNAQLIKIIVLSIIKIYCETSLISWPVGKPCYKEVHCNYKI